MQFPPPAFAGEWETEFTNVNVEATAMQATSATMFMLLTGSMLTDGLPLFLSEQPNYLPLLRIASLILLLTIFLLSYIKKIERFYFANFNILCSVLMITINLNFVWHALENFRPQLSFAQSIHRRREDSVQEISFRNEFDECNAIKFRANISFYFALINLLPMVLRMSPRSALVVTLADIFMWITLSDIMKIDTYELCLSVIFQASVGLSAVHFCESRLRIARSQFAMAKAARFAAEQTCSRLHTLIPPHVLPKLAAHTGSRMLGQLIPHCTVLFCTLRLPPGRPLPLAEQHALLDAVFSALDDAVSRSGMFKYQHVSEWYIVACPRAARPFYEEEQARPYPAAYAHDMLRLAFELQARLANVL
jgi:hypothetical protein